MAGGLTARCHHYRHTVEAGLEETQTTIDTNSKEDSLWCPGDGLDHQGGRAR